MAFNTNRAGEVDSASAGSVFNDPVVPAVDAGGSTTHGGTSGSQGPQGVGIDTVTSTTDASTGDVTVTITFEDPSGGTAPSTVMYTLPAGMKGDQGDQGIQGVDGPRGLVGPTGPAGATGHQGAQGQQGNTGAMGLQGVAGPNGESIYAVYAVDASGTAQSHDQTQPNHDYVAFIEATTEPTLPLPSGTVFVKYVGQDGASGTSVQGVAADGSDFAISLSSDNEERATTQAYVDQRAPGAAVITSNIPSTTGWITGDQLATLNYLPVANSAGTDLAAAADDSYITAELLRDQNYLSTATVPMKTTVTDFNGTTDDTSFATPQDVDLQGYAVLATDVSDDTITISANGMTHSFTLNQSGGVTLDFGDGGGGGVTTPTERFNFSINPSSRSFVQDDVRTTPFTVIVSNIGVSSSQSPTDFTFVDFQQISIVHPDGAIIPYDVTTTGFSFDIPAHVAGSTSIVFYINSTDSNGDTLPSHRVSTSVVVQEMYRSGQSYLTAPALDDLTARGALSLPVTLTETKLAPDSTGADSNWFVALSNDMDYIFKSGLLFINTREVSIIDGFQIYEIVDFETAVAGETLMVTVEEQ